MAKKKFFNYNLLLGDILNLTISFFVIIFWVPATAAEPLEKYGFVYLIYAVSWVLIALLFGRYSTRLRDENYFSTTFKLFYITLIDYAAFATYFYFMPNYSQWVLLAVVVTFFIMLFSVQSLFYAVIYASDPEEIPEHVEKRGPKTVLNPSAEIPVDAYNSMVNAMTKWTGERALQFLSSRVDLHSTNTYLLATTELFNFEHLPEYRYDTIINVRSLNNIRGINRMFSIVNEKLPDNGIFVGCFKDKSVKKKKILQKFPKGINWIVYACNYFIKRVIPKLFLTKRLYYDITKGRRRVLSKTEVFGRLYYCGFEVADEKKCNEYTYFIARRVKEPPLHKKRRYGPIIALNRIGKDGKRFKFYKMRTMYPYSEFLQGYIYEKSHLQEGGKFNHDIRIGTAGKLFRRYWIDELPMFINFFKGDMKLIGVRPLSKQYFSLYRPELQELRTKFKPGLFPPFYADMPKTLDEIQDSEMRYLRMCEARGSFITDITYFWKIFVNIVFKKARSK